MKKQKIALMLSVVLSASVMAKEEKGVQLFEQQVFQSESNTKMQLQELSQKEMEQTEGAAPMPPSGWAVGGHMTSSPSAPPPPKRPSPPPPPPPR